MAAKFGTSGLRGLVVELTQALVADYTRAFLAACPQGAGLMIGRDLRESSPAIASWVAEAAAGEGLPVTDLGALPTPALALAALEAGQGAIMVTGSHIPADRNGLKFYTPSGEITKAEERSILAALGRGPKGAFAPISTDPEGLAAYEARYVRAFGPQALAGLKLGLWQHSSVARDAFARVFRALGAEVVTLGRSESFFPVDTEAVDAATRSLLADWAVEHGLDAIVSTDGDADRPMLADGAGHILAGDLLGAITSAALGAEAVVTPISSNSAVDLMGRFKVTRTKIGSPYVIAGMEAAKLADPSVKVAGYEPNGGYLLGFTARGPRGDLAPLLTRDSLLPILAPLVQARAAGISLAALAARLPPRFTATDRLQEIAPDRASAYLAKLRETPAPFLAALGLRAEAARDETDGLRLTDQDGRVIHLRPSGNAPEFRVYVEAEDPAFATRLLARALRQVAAAL